jgi:hypothetical protein
VSGERSWPSRFRVTVRTNSGQAFLTWLSWEKAVAIAVTPRVAGPVLRVWPDRISLT